jgi:hypothetical protein
MFLQAAGAGLRACETANFQQLATHSARRTESSDAQRWYVAKSRSRSGLRWMMQTSNSAGVSVENTHVPKNTNSFTAPNSPVAMRGVGRMSAARSSAAARRKTGGKRVILLWWLAKIVRATHRSS